MKQYMMALDQGTTSCRCILFDRDGNVCVQAQKEFEQIYPKPGWVEHDAEVIWQTQYGVMQEAVKRQGISSEQIAGIGITNQRETTVVWNKITGKPVYHAIVWQCRRTSGMIDALKNEGFGEYIQEKTGLVPDAYFSGTKIAWILENVEGARENADKGELLFGTIDSWLIWKLTGGRVHVTDYTNASRTMLFDIHTLQWDKKILERLDIPESMLPEVKPSSCVYGYTAEGILDTPVPVAGAAGDQQAALFGQCCFGEGQTKNTYGTGGFLLMNTGKKPVISKNGLVTTIAVGIDDEVYYALEGSVFISGAAIQWLRDELKVIHHAVETEALALSVPDTAGAYVVPAFTGLGAPYWDQYARGTIVGLTRGFNRAHLVRATLESMAYQVSDILHAMENDAGVKIPALRVDGGACANNFLLQFQSDILGIDVIRPECIETTALGAAYLAGLAVKFWESREEIENNWHIARTFNPQMEEKRKNKLLKGWKKAVKCAFAWVEEDV